MQKNGKKLLAWMLAASMVFSFSMPTQAEKACFIKEKSGNNCGENLNA